MGTPRCCHVWILEADVASHYLQRPHKQARKMIPQIRRRSPRGEPRYFNDELIEGLVRRQRTDDALTPWTESLGERISDEVSVFIIDVNSLALRLHPHTTAATKNFHVRCPKDPQKNQQIGFWFLYKILYIKLRDRYLLINLAFSDFRRNVL